MSEQESTPIRLSENQNHLIGGVTLENGDTVAIKIAEDGNVHSVYNGRLRTETLRDTTGSADGYISIPEGNIFIYTDREERTWHDYAMFSPLESNQMQVEEILYVFEE